MRKLLLIALLLSACNGLVAKNTVEMVVTARDNNTRSFWVDLHDPRSGEKYSYVRLNGKRCWGGTKLYVGQTLDVMVNTYQRKDGSTYRSIDSIDLAWKVC